MTIIRKLSFLDLIDCSKEGSVPAFFSTQSLVLLSVHVTRKICLNVFFGSLMMTVNFWPKSAKFRTYLKNKCGESTYVACLGGAVGSVTVRAAWLRWSASPGSRPGLARSLCEVIAVYAFRLNSLAGTEGSTVSSLICDRWLILGSETLSISRCLNHW